MKQIASILCAIVILSQFLFDANIHASGLSYADNQIFSSGYVDFRDAGALSVSMYPFAISKKKLSFQTSHRSLYGLKELTDNQFAVTTHLRDFTIGAGGAVFGKSDYFQQMGLSLFGNHSIKGLVFGFAIIYNRLSFNASYNDISYTACNLGLSKTYNNFLLFGTARNINRPKYYNSSDKLPLEAECGISYLSKSSLDSQISVLLREHEKPTAMTTQSFKLDKRIQLNWTLVLYPIRFGGGLDLETSHLGFNYKVSHHPVLGMTHTVLLSVFLPNENLTD
ncbi:MAG: hypothetical protein KAR42_02235 [candidate division Zixibacteria bacterium]|nr:hypothetical protein [candidate division Zixibacteria bacterium]